MYVFGDFTLDLSLYQLRRADQVVPLEPKVFDVLRFLVEHHERVATKRELLESLWPNEVVTEAVLPTNINALRRALGQKRGEKTPIETVHGRGYRFSAAVRRSAQSEAPLSVAPLLSLTPSVMPDGREAQAVMVGQLPLLDKLRKLLALALSEQGQICVLSGEAGIGKTRMARTLSELARAHGADVWLGTCEEGRDSPPLWVFQQLLRSALTSEGPETLRRWLGPLAHELGTLLPLLADSREVRLLGAGPDQDSFRVFDAMTRVLSQASRARPRVLWLEDMHRADEASWQLLRLLAPHFERASVLVIVTVRSRDDLTVVMPVQRNLDLLQRTPHCHRFLVRGLEVEQVAELASTQLGTRVDDELARALHDKTGGNPLFVRELVDWLDVRGRTDAAALREGPNLAPSELVRHVLRRRVVRLGTAAQKLLEAAAVVGSTWDAALVERATNLSREMCIDVIDAALAHRVIVPVSGRVDAYRFAHDLVRDTLYSDLPTRERRHLHLQLAGALEERIAWLGAEGVRDVAQHLYMALPDADAQRAIASLERAAELCEECGAFRDAAYFYRCALDAARLLPVADPALSHALSASQERLDGLARDARLQS
jgi:DNA-binding winged helix-turn-helix (wHTH) protein/predicted ATPase